MKSVIRILISASLVFTLSGFVLFDKMFAPKSDLWPFWNIVDTQNLTAIDHVDWAVFLGRYLSMSSDGIAMLSYGKVSGEDHRKLLGYVNRLAGLKIRSYRKPEQLAYWINLYNARTALLILDNYPVESITDIKLSGGFFTSGPWSEKIMLIEGQAVSLNDIEHRILRPIWQDPRVHYALNCASRGCPNLPEVPFTSGNASQLLDKGASDFVNHPRGVRQYNDGLVLSKIYAWFEDDFGGDNLALFAHLSRYADDDLQTILKTKPAVSKYEYDWRLNDAIRR
ncbi:MAG: DUF547 domain-containing protein [Alphaproteobacteria bacterium]|nr:DUF547 domain-containing protein [Alphaproteobacteria bacterium]MBT4083024.1 DUF547 domain-containing protein [Alphaproteobacteria bacterium]MBT4543059.1 DUF547 domain-containing protein [Alphaproteobacteria bacterium]MBT7746660.1 DUF547 domain-containing protein [Alphaproteobacteria bacterium]